MSVVDIKEHRSNKGQARRLIKMADQLRDYGKALSDIRMEVFYHGINLKKMDEVIRDYDRTEKLLRNEASKVINLTK
jgi:hypothetical protein